MSRFKSVCSSFLSSLKTKKILAYFASIFLTIAVFLFSGYTMTGIPKYRTYCNVLLIFLFIALLIAFILKIKIPKDKKTPKECICYIAKYLKFDAGFFFLVYVTLIGFISLIVSKDFTSNGFKTYVTTICMFGVAYGFVKSIGYKRAINGFKKVFPWICAISLLIYGILNIFSLSYPVNQIISSTNVTYNNYLFVYFDYVGLTNRNCSIFWEPATFAIFVSFAICLDLATSKNKIRYWALIIYFASLVTTFSISGFISLVVALFIGILLMNEETVRKNFFILILIILVGAAVIVPLILLVPAIRQKLTFNGSSSSLYTRLFGCWVNLKIAFDHPLGVGFSNEFKIFQEYGSIVFEKYVITVQTCTFGYWISVFGIPGMLVLLTPLISLFFVKKIKLIPKIVIVVGSLVFMICEPLQNNLILLILLFYCFEENNYFLNKRRELVKDKETSSLIERAGKDNTSILAKNSLLTMLVKGIALIVSLMTMSSYIEYFADPKGEGLLSLWLTVLSVLTWILVFDLGIGHGLKNKLITAYEEKNDKKIKSIISSAYISVSLISLIIFALGSAFIWLVDLYTVFNIQKSLIDILYLRWSLWIILLAICLNFIFKLIGNIYESIQKQWASNSFAIVQTLALLLFAAFANFSSNNVRLVSIAVVYLAASTLPMLMATILLFSRDFKKYTISFKFVTKESTRSVMSLGVMFFLIQLLMAVLTATNTYIVQLLFGSIHLGAASEYSYYHKIFNIIIVFSSLLSGPIWAIVAKAKATGDVRFINKLNKFVLVSCFAFMFVVAIMFGILPFIFEVWIPNAIFEFSWLCDLVFAVSSYLLVVAICLSSINNGLSKLTHQFIGFLFGVIIKVSGVLGISILIKKGTSIPWYFVEATNVLALVPVIVFLNIGNKKNLKDLQRGRRVFLFSYFSKLIDSNRNAPYASEPISLYVKDLLESKKDQYDFHCVNLAPSIKPIAFEANKEKDSYHQIGTICFGKIYRKFIWKKIYWLRVYNFCKKNLTRDDTVIIYHSLYTVKLIKKLKQKLKCKVILIGAEIYSDVTNNKRVKQQELECYKYANGHILISPVLRKNISITRPSTILSGDYRSYDRKISKFSEKDGKIHLVYSGTFDKVKGGVYGAVDAMNHLDNHYVLHLLGFGDNGQLKEYIDKCKAKERIVIEQPKRGEEFLSFLSGCDIGLSTQVVGAEFNNTSFPSKIITYLRAGLKVVSTPSISVLNSDFKNSVEISEYDDGKSIAEAICRANGNGQNKENNIDEIRDKFENEFYNLISMVKDNKRYLLLNNCFGGSTGNIASSIKDYLIETGNDAVFYYFRGKRQREFGTQKYGCAAEHYIAPLLTRITGNLYGYLPFTTLRMKQITKRFEPDLVNMHCSNSYTLNLYSYLHFLKEHNIKTSITNHALFFATGNCAHPCDKCEKYKTGCGKCPDRRYSCKSLIIDRTRRNWNALERLFSNSNFDMVCVSDYVKEFLESSPITKDLHSSTILNGIDTNVFTYKDHKKKDDKINILYINSSVKGYNKGFNEFVKIAKEFESNCEFVFHIVGNIKRIGLKNVICHNDIVGKEKMAELYQQSDLTIITSRRETFSLPVAESLCCGTPVVGYKCGGPETFTKSPECTLFEYGDKRSVREYMLSRKYFDMDKANISKKYKNILNIEEMQSKYLEHFRGLTK